jgi:uncharacterized membrane protein YadS
MTVVVLCILFCYCILLIGFILSWHSIPYFLYSGNTIEKVKSYVSVIVAARNEAENIAFLLKLTSRLWLWMMVLMMQPEKW